MASLPSSRELVHHLGFIAHDEGGFYRPVYPSIGADRLGDISCDGQPDSRYSTMFYMLTAESPLGYLHVNKADIVHCFHAGSPLTYLLITPDGRLTRRVLGPDLARGHELQIVVSGGTWKATVLEAGEFGLISEVAVPAFDSRDREFGTGDRIRRLFPSLWSELASYLKPDRDLRSER
ncbi:MAG: cupin domain-containing protein [Nitrospirae bacterium]|nr:MAG: cupin domain-containing protein [Nitrospirota bacterium]